MMQQNLQAALNALTTGSIIAGRYEIVGPLAKGGMGLVYRAKQVALDRMVAFKVLPMDEDPTAYQRFELEAKASAGLTHPNIVSIYDYGRMDDGRPYIVMELIEGAPLFKLLRLHGRLDESYAASIFVQVCDGLYCAHRQGVVHRDLKPGNILVMPTPTGDIAKLIDFGLAKRFYESQNLTKSGVLVGTPLYMSPEQCRGETTDARSDIYALGCVLYQMIVGSPPFEGDSPIATMYKHLLDDPDFNRADTNNVSEEMKKIILRCTAKDQERRYQSALELKNALHGILSGTNKNNSGPNSLGSLESKNNSAAPGTLEKASIDKATDCAAPANKEEANSATPSSGTRDQPNLKNNASDSQINSSNPPEQGLTDLLATASASSKPNITRSTAEAPGDTTNSANQTSSTQLDTSVKSSAELTLRGSLTNSTNSFVSERKECTKSFQLNRSLVLPGTLLLVALILSLLAYSVVSNNNDLKLTIVPYLEKINKNQAFMMCAQVADDLFEKGDTHKALLTYEQARRLCAEHLVDFEPSRVAHVETMLSCLYQLKPQLHQALRSAENAKNIMEKNGLKSAPEYASALGSIAEIHFKQGKIKQAEQDCQKAMSAFKLQTAPIDGLMTEAQCSQLRVQISARLKSEQSETIRLQASGRSNTSQTTAAQPGTERKTVEEVISRQPKRTGIRSASEGIGTNYPPSSASYPPGAPDADDSQVIRAIPRSVVQQLKAANIDEDKVAKQIGLKKTTKKIHGANGLIRGLKKVISELKQL